MHLEKILLSNVVGGLNDIEQSRNLRCEYFETKAP